MVFCCKLKAVTYFVDLVLYLFYTSMTEELLITHFCRAWFNNLWINTKKKKKQKEKKGSFLYYWFKLNKYFRAYEINDMIIFCHYMIVNGFLFKKKKKHGVNKLQIRTEIISATTIMTLEPALQIPPININWLK